jgi:hemerythrin-like domain-containing protein
MVQEITRLESPIDAMFLIHNALRAQAANLEELVRSFETGDSLQLIRLDFVNWAAALMFHAEQEDQSMMRLLNGYGPAVDGVREHAELEVKLEEVVTVFSEEIGETQVIARTQRHLHGAVVALRIAQDDHLESEEAFVLPEVRERFDEIKQLEMMRCLLIDDEAADRRWVMEWMNAMLPSGECQLLGEFERRCSTVAVPGR